MFVILFETYTMRHFSKINLQNVRKSQANRDNWNEVKFQSDSNSNYFLRM